MVGDEYGIRWVRNYLLTDEPPLEGLLLGKESPMRDLYPELRDLGQDEHPFAYTSCSPVRHDDDRAAVVFERDAA